MQRFLVFFGAFSCVALAACDRMPFAIRNTQGSPLEIEVRYLPKSECKSGAPFTIEPGKSYVSRCYAADVAQIIIYDRQPTVLSEDDIRLRLRRHNGTSEILL